MSILNLRFLTLIFIGCLGFNNLTFANSNFCEQFLEPLQIRTLMKKVDWKNLESDGSTVTPSYDVVVYDKANESLLRDLKLPLSKLSSKDRIVETAYGYAIVDVDQLRDWQMLSSVINEPVRAREFLEKVGNTEGYYPNGITKESADWLRWSVFARYDSARKAHNKAGRPPTSDEYDFMEFMMKDLEYSMAVDHEKREIFRRLVRQKNVYIFPFGITDITLDLNEIREDNAVIVLQTLTRYFMLSKLLVKRPSGEYILLSEFIGNDSLMLLSRHPNLISLYPMFEDGHFEIPREYVIGHQDTYSIASKKLIISEMKEEVKYTVKVNQNIYYEDDSVESNISVSFDDYSSLEDGYSKLLNVVSAEDVKKLLSELDSDLNNFVARKTSEFREVTGVDIPEFIVEHEDDSDLAIASQFTLKTNQDVDPVVYSAFLMFMALDN